MTKKKLWSLLVISAAIMWGISSLCATALFHISSNINALWLSQMRQLIAGPLLLIIAAITGHSPFKIFKSGWRNWLILIDYGLIAILPAQFCYFMAVQKGNAAIATILQFIGPFFVIAYLALFYHQRPLRIQVLAAIIAFIGIILLTAHGHANLSITPAVLFWGLLAAVGVAGNSLIPQRLIQKGYPSLLITGWGITISGIILICIHPAQPHLPQNNLIWVYLAAIVLVGTLIPFQLTTNSLKYISPTTLSLSNAFEPVTATIGSMIFFSLYISPVEWLGAALIVIAVMSLNLPAKIMKFI